MTLRLSTGDVSIINCIIHNNSATCGGGGGVTLSLSTGMLPSQTAHFRTTVLLMVAMCFCIHQRVMLASQTVLFISIVLMVLVMVCSWIY